MLTRRAALPLLVLGVVHARTLHATEPAKVHFASGEPGVTVYSRPVPPERLAGTEQAGERPDFAPLCEAPCDAALDPAVHEFALAPAGGDPIPAEPAFEIRADARFRGDIVSHESDRTTGWWILGTMGAAGATSTTIGLLQTCVDDQTCQEWTSLAIWSGVAVVTAGVLIGLPKIVMSDEAMLTLVPGTAPPASPAGAALPGVERAPIVTAGATLSGHF